MKIKRSICVIVFFTCICVNAMEFELKLERTIGDEREDYTFFDISSAVVSEDKDIYVADRKGHFIAKYTWDGLFKKRIGQKGQGPGDFNSPTSLNLSGTRLFVYDFINRRIVTADKDLNIMNYNKFKSFKNTLRCLYLTHDNRFIGDDISIQEENKIRKLKIIDIDGNILHSFFENIILKDKINTLNLKQRAMLRGFANLVIGIDRGKKNILVTHGIPQNPAEFFLYTTEGKYIKGFTYEFDKKYKFPSNYILNPGEKHLYSLQCTIDSIFIYKEYYLVFLTYFRKENGASNQEYFALLFDRNGKLIQEKLISTKDIYRFYYITGDGYLIGKKYDEVIEKLYMFKLQLSGS